MNTTQYEIKCALLDNSYNFDHTAHTEVDILHLPKNLFIVKSLDVELLDIAIGCLIDYASAM